MRDQQQPEGYIPPVVRVDAEAETILHYWLDNKWLTTGDYWRYVQNRKKDLGFGAKMILDAKERARQ